MLEVGQIVAGHAQGRGGRVGSGHGGPKRRTGDWVMGPQPASMACASALQVARMVIGTSSLVPSV